MAEGMVQDRVFLALLFIVGGSSLVWGLYLLFYVAPTSPSGIFNSVLGLVVLFVTWAYLVPYVIPARTRRPLVPAVPPAARSSPGLATARTPRPVAASPKIGRPAPTTTPFATPSPTASPPPAAATPAARPARVAASAADVFALPLSGRAALPPVRTTAGSPATAAPSAPPLDSEVEFLLSDLSAPADDALDPMSPDEVVDRLDALQRDLTVRAARRSPGPNASG